MWGRKIHRLELVNNLSEKLNTEAVAWIREAWVLASIVHAIAKKGLSSSSSAMKIMQEWIVPWQNCWGMDVWPPEESTEHCKLYMGVWQAWNYVTQSGSSNAWQACATVHWPQTVTEYCKMCIGLCQGQAWNQVVKSVLIARRAYRMVGWQW